MKTLLAFALLLPPAALIQPALAQPAPPPSAPTNAIAINCADWNKTPDGDWKSKPGTTVSAGAQHLTFKGERIEEGTYTLAGQDLYALLDQTCAH
jgi:hypothetical protein